MSRMMTAGAGTITPVWRRNSQGQLIQIENPDRTNEVKPTQGVRCRFLLSGISEAFDLESAQYGITTNVRVEFTILKAQGNVSAILNGKYFSQLFSWRVSAKSNLGKLFGALRGYPIEGGEQIDPDWFIGTEFVSSTTLTQNGNPAISIEAIDPSSIKLSPHVPRPAAQLNAFGASEQAADGAGGSLDEDPFEQGEDPL